MLTPKLRRKIHHIEIRSRRLVADTLAGDYHTHFKGRGIAFSEVRPYQPGDDVRVIDWNVTARMQAPYIKRFSEERQRTMLLLVDISGSTLFGSQTFEGRPQQKRDLAAELAAVLAFAATANNDNVGLVTFSDRTETLLPPRKGRAHILRLVRTLLTADPTGRGTDLSGGLETANRLLKQRGIIILISDFMADPDRYARLLRTTNQRHDLIALHLHDPLEAMIPKVGLLAMEDAETGRVVTVDTADPAWRATAEQQFRHRDHRLRRLFTQAQVDRIIIPTGRPYVRPLIRFFAQRIRRR